MARKTKQTRMRRTRDIIRMAFNGIINALQSPYVLFGLVLGYLAFTNQAKFKEILKKFESNVVFGKLIQQLLARPHAAAGALMTSISTLSIGRPAQSLAASLVVFVVTAFILPEQSLFREYFFLTLFIVLTWRTSNPRLQFLYFIIAICTVAMELWGSFFV